ncbi:hypothetical protein [Halorussus aquaticus]|uniref:Uncharacterized protein n=1 Tax=Halorussus aquaticus TaxID=2953748 RepID=A0ABD5Q8V5_9EURY|nr:hypothetical protein [Halorussus aquaticus]
MIKNRRWTLLIVGSIVIIGLSLAIYLSYEQFGRAGLEASSILTSSLLTIALVVLYREQHLALRYQQEPHLEISDIEIKEDLQVIRLRVSNFGGGPATSMKLRIGLYELSGEGPIETVQGSLRRIESIGDAEEEKTRASSIRPSELNICFEATSRSVISLGGTGPNQDSLARILDSEFEGNRDVIYGKVSVYYSTKFSKDNRHISDFSLQFNNHDDIDYIPMDFLPWEDENMRRELGS